MRMKHLLFPLITVVALACGGDGGTGPSQTFENIAGTYVGAVTATTQGVHMDGNFSITITQSQGDLGGTHSLAGTLSNNSGSTPFQGSGSLQGTIAPGSNPSVNITASNATCPNVPGTLSGTYDSANRALTFPSTSIPFFDQNCQVALTFTNIGLVLHR
jgi:hypothetical protein